MSLATSSSSVSALRLYREAEAAARAAVTGVSMSPTIALTS